MAPRDGYGGLDLTAQERQMLIGDRGPAVATAMRIVCTMAHIAGARQLVEITSAHIDSCLYHGPVGLDFAERLVAGRGRAAVPTTLNVAALDLLHPELVRLDEATRSRARRLMDAYVELGCEPTWTCAPYQLPARPKLGEHVAWAESNAIVFANSVLGARTGRYGDFIDICAALTGRVPLAGLHVEGGRRAGMVFRLDDGLAARFARRRPTQETYGLIGHLVGQRAGGLVPAVVGLPADTNEDELKALGAAAASAGSVALCHVVGVTPEAATLQAAGAVDEVTPCVEIGAADLARAWDELSTAHDGAPLGAVSIGTPHFSPTEFERLDELLAGRAVASATPLYVSTGRAVLAQIGTSGLADRLNASGVTIVTDTCTYITPILRAAGGTVMTNSAKWAWYAPGNLGVEVVYGSLGDCVESAVRGKVIRELPDYLDG